MKALVCALVSFLLVAVAFAEAHAGASPAPSRWRRHSRSLLETEEAGAARQLLISLLGSANAASGPLLAALMPTTDDPCLPAGLSTREVDPATAAANTSATEGRSSGGGGGASGADFEGTCGPQRTAWSDTLYGSSSMGQGTLPPGAPAPNSAPASPRAPTPLCAWKWLSCDKWRIVAVNLSCGPPDQGCKGGPVGVPMTGSLPASAMQLTALGSLDLSGQERLVGGLPLEAWTTASWSSLTFLNLSGCGLSGSIPSNWAPLPSLEVLDLSFNRLEGTLPTSLADLKQLTHLSLAGNEGLTGYLPNAWDSMGRLRLLDVRGDCRLCGSTTGFTSLTTALTQGSHVDDRCRPNDCVGTSRKMRDVFLGVMAAFTSVLGFTALLLVLRRVSRCAANWPVGAAASARPAAGPATSAREQAGDLRRASTSAADGRSQPHRRPRPRRPRRFAGPPQAVPLYTVELGPEDYVKWWVEIAGPPVREQDPAVREQDPAVREPHPASGGGGGGGGVGGSSSSRQQLEMMELASPPLPLQSPLPLPPPPQQQQQPVQQQQPYGRQRGWEQQPERDQGEGGQQQRQQQQEEQEERDRVRELSGVVGPSGEVRRTAGRAAAEALAEDPAAAMAAAAAGPGPTSAPLAEGAAEGAAAQAALPPAEDEDVVQVLNAVLGPSAAAAAGSLDAASGLDAGRPFPRPGSVGAEDATASQPAAAAAGASPYAAAAGAVPDVRRQLARPPDAVILMPDGVEVCLGRLMASHSHGVGGDGGDGARCRSMWTRDLAAALADAAAEAATISVSAPVTLLEVGGTTESASGGPRGGDRVGGNGPVVGSPAAVAAAAARSAGAARGTPSGRARTVAAFEVSSSEGSSHTGSGGGGGDSGDDVAAGPAACPGRDDFETAVVMEAAEAEAASPPGSAVATDTATTVQGVGPTPGWAAPATL